MKLVKGIVIKKIEDKMKQVCLFCDIQPEKHCDKTPVLYEVRTIPFSVCWSCQDCADEVKLKDWTIENTMIAVKD